MRRHGWAFCLGLFLSGAAVAQPPADEERFPPAPDLPGEVVGQLPGPRPTAKVTQKDAKLAPTAPLPEAVLAPFSGTVTTTVTPVEPMPAALPASMGMAHQPAGCLTPVARSGCCISLGDIKNWLCFRSQAKQSDCYRPPYCPPLQAWFPCDVKNGNCGSGLRQGGGCASCASGAPIVPPMVTGDVKIAPQKDGNASAEPPLVGGVPTGKCADSDVLTSFQPVNPGLGFAPGAAPMANPTTQVKASTWKPR